MACEAVEFMLENGIEVAAIVTPPKSEPEILATRLVDTADKYDIPIVTDTDLYELIAGQKTHPRLSLDAIDLVLSIVFQNRIRRPLIDLPKIGCLNFHPAPLPEYRGWGTYSLGIMHDAPQWGASAHFVDEKFDTGDLIKVMRFDVNMRHETAYSLEQRTQPVMLELFKDVISTIVRGDELARRPQEKGVNHITKRQFEAMRQISDQDSAEVIEKKTRAFWYPPYLGAQVTVAGKPFTLVSNPMLAVIGHHYHRKQPG